MEKNKLDTFYVNCPLFYNRSRYVHLVHGHKGAPRCQCVFFIHESSTVFDHNRDFVFQCKSVVFRGYGATYSATRRQNKTERKCIFV